MLKAEQIEELERLEKASRVGGVVGETPGAMVDLASRLGAFVDAARNALPELLEMARENESMRGSVTAYAEQLEGISAASLSEKEFVSRRVVAGILRRTLAGKKFLTGTVRLMRNTSTPEGKAFWEHAQQCADEARDWPDSRRAGINVSTIRQKLAAVTDELRELREYTPDYAADNAKLSADLLATRRALKLAQAKGLDRLAWLVRVSHAEPNEFPKCFRRNNKRKALKLLLHWQRRFEREAEAT